jgi:hypothetical protein
MPQRTFPISENAQIQIRHCAERVVVTGWDDTRTVATDCDARQEGNTLIIENAERILVRVPRAASVLITDCNADVRVDDLAGRVEIVKIDGDIALRNLRGETIVRDIDGDLSARDIAQLRGQGEWQGDVALRDIDACTIDAIEDDASLRNMGATEIQKIGGDLNVVGNRGALSIGEVEGDVNLREVNARATIQHIGDDLVASEVNAALDLPDVAGDAVISFAQAVDLKLSAKEDVIIRLPSNSDADIELDAPRGNLIARHEIQIIKQDERHLRGTIGKGGTKIQAESTHGDLIFEGDQPMRHAHNRELHQHFARMGQEIAQEVRASVRASLADIPQPKHHRHHRVEFHLHDDEPEAEEPQAVKPGLSQTDRKAILDAIGRGEMSVDDGIKKLRGEA